jgi:hypothetical protein
MSNQNSISLELLTQINFPLTWSWILMMKHWALLLNRRLTVVHGLLWHLLQKQFTCLRARTRWFRLSLNSITHSSSRRRFLLPLKPWKSLLTLQKKLEVLLRIHPLRTIILISFGLSFPHLCLVSKSTILVNLLPWWLNERRYHISIILPPEVTLSHLLPAWWWLHSTPHWGSRLIVISLLWSNWRFTVLSYGHLNRYYPTQILKVLYLGRSTHSHYIMSVIWFLVYQYPVLVKVRVQITLRSVELSFMLVVFIVHRWEREQTVHYLVQLMDLVLFLFAHLFLHLDILHWWVAALDLVKRDDHVGRKAS